MPFLLPLINNVNDTIMILVFLSVPNIIIVIVIVLCKVRERPLTCRGGGYGFLFRLEFFFRTTRELEYKTNCRAMRDIFSRIKH